jgi:Xaa-Pro aminopeptidase
MDRKERRTPPAERLRARRASVLEALGAGVMVLPATPVQFSSRDTDLAYRPDSELFYLTGVEEPDAVAVLSGGDPGAWTLFVAERDSDRELWGGPRDGPAEAVERFGPDACHPLSELDRRLPDLLAPADRVYARLGRGDTVERLVVQALERGRARGPRTGTGPRGVVDPGEILDDLRLRKDADEIERIRAAAALTVEGHRAAAAAIRPGRGEWWVQAELEAAFGRGGGAPAFGTIVGSGANACVLHYRANDAYIADGALVLVDAGAELALYNGDVTRTYPASGRLTDAQRRVYDLVEAARAASVAAVRPGVTVAAVHQAAVRVLVEGLVDLGVLHGDVDDLVAQDAHKPFYPHQTSHWLGLDVHDPGDYARGGAPRTLEPGMVLTVEPGLYFRPGGDERVEPYAGIGVRIEDDVLVTETGHENLTQALPTAPDDIEKLMDDLR